MHSKSALVRWPVLAFCAVVAMHLDCVMGADPRPWTVRNGHRFEAELLAVDGLRATLGLAGAPKWNVPLSDLAPADAEFAQSWRKGRRNRPLVDPRLLAAWPPQAGDANVEVQAAGEDAGQFRYESANFIMHSDVKLPLPVARDLAMVFEGTRAALIAAPLGLHAGGEENKYSVLFTESADAYAAAGGAPNTGGYYEPRTRRTLVFLPNLGIETKKAGTELRYSNQLFVLKHEITHQLLARWHGPLPFWFHEGLPEFIASLPYSRGRYTVQNPGVGMRDYLLKWRQGPNDRTVRLVPLERLMQMDAAEWNAAVAQRSAYDLYNSANLLTFYFVQQRNGAPIAAFLEALRRGVPMDVAQNEHLLAGRKPAELTKDLIALGRRLGVEVKVTE